MSRLLKTIIIAFFLGAGVGALDSLTLLIREDGIRLLSPLLDVTQLFLTYGIAAAFGAAVIALLFKKWEPVSAASASSALLLFAASYIWVHSRIMANRSMFDMGSLMMTGGIVVSCLVFVWIVRFAARHKKAPIFLVLFPILPGLLPLTKGVDLVTEPIAEPAQAGAPNVTFLLLDTQRADRLSCYGYERADGKKTSPVIDGLAEQGVRFEWHYSAAPWTRPSVASMFTGLYPTSHHAFLPERVLPSWTATIAEMYHEMGYQTAGFSTNANISAVWGFAQGFQHFWGLDDKELIDMVAWGEAEMRLRRMFKLFHQTPDNARIVHEQVFPWLDSVKDSERPVFTYIQYLDPHFPYHPEEDIINDVTPNFEDLVAQVESKDGTFLPYPFGERPMPPRAVVDGFEQLYDAEIAFMDREIGNLIERLKANNLLGENDWLIITSDHGEEFFEHNQWGHGQNVYQEVLRVPLIIIGPGVPEGMVIQTPVSLVDMLPTLADIMDNPEFLRKGVNELKDEDGNPSDVVLRLPGSSMVPLWEDESNQSQQRAIYSEKLREPENYGLRIGGNKLVQVYNRDLKVDYQSFYDVANDPLEINGYIPDTMEEYPLPPQSQPRFGPVPDGLQDAVGDLMERMKLEKTVAKQLDQGGEERSMTPDERARMQELGYLELDDILKPATDKKATEVETEEED
ncbi:MAG: sulfatase-like hydrolase/transferase [Planctomycetes bacterium]|nr:sulfatase-like hydrolase/transferase [Planctomycetota bacterium]